MHDDLSFEDMIAFFEQGLISKELATKYLEDISKDLNKIESVMVPSDTPGTIVVDEIAEFSAVDWEKMKRWREERAKMTESQWKQEMYGSWYE